jgi:hypothetical protein
VDVLAAQLAAVQRRYPAARVESAPDGSRVLIVPDLRLCCGWNASATTVRVLIPVGFPHVKPDCFYVDATLRLASGAEPASSNLQSIFGGQYRWYSWHIATWDPARGSLDQYLHVCESRLREVR